MYARKIRVIAESKIENLGKSYERQVCDFQSLSQKSAQLANGPSRIAKGLNRIATVVASTVAGDG
jgi:hypothetical protein